MPQSSTVWWSSICRSPVAATRMSMRLWRASWSSMWSKNPTPVDMSAFPVPSRSTSTEIRVSVVSRSIFAVRMRFSRCVWCLIGAPDAGSKRLDPRSHHRLCGRTRRQHRHGGAVSASRGGGGAGGGYGTGELSLAGRAGGVGGIHAPGRDAAQHHRDAKPGGHAAGDAPRGRSARRDRSVRCGRDQRPARRSPDLGARYRCPEGAAGPREAGPPRHRGKGSVRRDEYRDTTFCIFRRFGAKLLDLRAAGAPVMGRDRHLSPHHYRVGRQRDIDRRAVLTRVLGQSVKVAENSGHRRAEPLFTTSKPSQFMESPFCRATRSRRGVSPSSQISNDCTFSTTASATALLIRVTASISEGSTGVPSCASAGTAKVMAQTSGPSFLAVLLLFPFLKGRARGNGWSTEFVLWMSTTRRPSSRTASVQT